MLCETPELSCCLRSWGRGKGGGRGGKSFLFFGPECVVWLQPAYDSGAGSCLHPTQDMGLGASRQQNAAGQTRTHPGGFSVPKLSPVEPPPLCCAQPPACPTAQFIPSDGFISPLWLLPALRYGPKQVWSFSGPWQSTP